MVCQLGQLALHPGQDEHGTQARIAPAPVTLRVGAQLRRQKLGLGVVQVRRGDHDIGVDSALIRAHACYLPIRDLDGGNLLAQTEGGAKLLRLPVDGLDHGGETTLWVAHSLHKIGVAHQGIQGRGGGRLGG